MFRPKITTTPKKAKKPALKRQNASIILYQQPKQKMIAPQEINYVDLAANNYSCSTTGFVQLVSTILQGTTVNQRIGKRAYYKSLLLRGVLTAGLTGTVGDATIMLVYDKRPTGALPAITDVLTGISSFAFMNDNNTGRFEVLRRWDHVLVGNATAPSTGQEAINFDYFVPLKKRPITFESLGSGAIADIDMGAIYLITCGSIVAGTAAPVLSVAIRTRFTEL